ncbi:MAG: dipeptidase [Candidatus Hydrogenedentota bacterium]
MIERLRQLGQWAGFVLLLVLYAIPPALLAGAVLLGDFALGLLAIAFGAGMGAFTLSAPFLLMALANSVAMRKPPPVPQEAQDLHSRLMLADMHADTFMWQRDILRRSRWGHVDVPRMREGNAGLYVFTATTSVPLGMNFASSPRTLDMLTALHALQGWPRTTWFSLKDRALYMLARMDDAASRSGGQFMVIRSLEDLTRYLARRGAGEWVGACLPGIQGVHCFEHQLKHVKTLFEAGFRMAGLTHFFDNAAGGSAHGVRKYGLTDFGRAAVARMQELGMIIDLAHAAPQLMDDVLAQATRPLVISHTGPKGVHESNRTVSDDHLRAVAATGGVAGIGFWKHVVGGPGVDPIADAICYVCGLVGDAHVGLGSDFDGVIPAPFDASGMPVLTQKLLERGLSEESIARIMGGNVLRVIEGALPEKA